MNTFTLFAPIKRKHNLLSRLQKFGNAHFSCAREEESTALSAAYNHGDAASIEDSLAKARFAALKLAPFAIKPKGIAGMTAKPPTITYDDFERLTEQGGWRDICAAVAEITERITRFRAERDRLTTENAALYDWRGFDTGFSEIEGLKFCRAVFGEVDRQFEGGFAESVAEEFPMVYIEKAAATRAGAIYMAIAPNGDYDSAVVAMKKRGFTPQTPAFDEIPADMAERNNAIIAEIDDMRAEAQAELAELAKGRDDLLAVIDCLETRLERINVCRNFLMSQTVLVIEGWVPTRLCAAMGKEIEDVCGEEFYLDEALAEKGCADVPIKLRNNRVFSAFESVTAMYSMPKYGEIDPTPLLAPFYMLFFAAMIGDAGFGLVLLAASSVALKYFNLKEGGRNFMRFFFWLSIPTVLIGCLFGSLFGFTFLTPVPVAGGGRKPVIDTGIDIVNMIIISVALGTVQVVFGLGVKGYMLIRDGRPLAAIADSLLWITALLGGIGLILSMAGVVGDGKIWLWVMVGSLIGLAATQGRESKSIGGKIGTGLYAVYGITGYVGDLVSYTRLMALSLSGAYIGYSFIMISHMFTGPLFWTVGLVIIIAGQALNLGLGALGAYVHSCRLQFVEFFGKFYEGGGVQFKPFTTKTNFVNIGK